MRTPTETTNRTRGADSRELAMMLDCSHADLAARTEINITMSTRAYRELTCAFTTLLLALLTAVGTQSAWSVGTVGDLVSNTSAASAEDTRSVRRNDDIGSLDTGPQFGNAVQFSGDIPSYDINGIDAVSDLRVLRWRDTSGVLTQDQLPPSDQWTLDTAVKPAGTNGREWIWFRLVNSGPVDQRAVISFDEAFLEEANFYIVDTQGNVETVKNGLQTRIPDRGITTRVPALAVALAAGESRDILLSQRSRLEAIMGIQVQAPAEFAVWVEKQSAGFAFFFGGAAAIIIFNLFLFASIRDPLYFIYSLHASFVVFFVARYSGFTFYFFDTPGQHYPLASATWIQAALLVVFTRRLLDSPSLGKWIDLGLKASVVWFCFVAIATFFDVEFHKVGVRSSLVLTLSYLGVGVYSAMRGNPLGVFYSLAQTPYLIGYFLLAGASIGVLEASFTTRYGFIIGTFFELVTFSLALGYRFRLVEQEKFNTQTDLLALQGSLNEQLKIQVDERTQELENATEELRSINSDYEALLQSVSVGVASIDLRGQKTFANTTYQVLEKSIPQLSQTINRHIGTESLSGTHELTIKGKNNVEHHLLLSTAERLTADGKQTGFWLVVTDVTDMRQKEASLNQAAKMATLGEMSTGMAHELNQPLNVIRLTMENVRRKLDQDTLQPDFLLGKFDRINDQVTRASKLVSLMRTFGRVAPAAFEPFDLIESTFRAIDLMQEQLRLSQIQVSADLPQNVPALVNGSSSQYEQVLINLMTNARDAINLGHTRGGTIDVRFKVEGDAFIISVEDTGGGIAEDAIDRVFEPFFTTKPVGEGTGLGGAISYGIINDMNGSISARNTNLGALVEIRLPKHHPSQDN